MGLFKSIKSAARERGHQNIFGYIAFCFHYLFNYTLTVIATFAPYGLVNVVQSLRGVKIGKDVFIDRTTYIDEVYPHLVTLEDGATIAPRVVIMAHAKLGDYLIPYLGPTQVKSVRVGKGAFIGVNSVIAPGVTIGEGAVISAGTFVNKDVPAHALVAGNPMKVITILQKRELKREAKKVSPNGH